jgi:hypothetical protein
MREPSGGPPLSNAAFPELLGTAEPAPAARPRGSRLIKVLARVTLRSLIIVSALRGLMPAPDGPGPAAAADPPEDRRAAAVAVAFLREYLTVGDDRTARTQRLGRFAATGVHLGRSVSLPDGDAQYADLVVAAGSRWGHRGARGDRPRSHPAAPVGRLSRRRDVGVRRAPGRPARRDRGRRQAAPTSLPLASGLPLPRPPRIPPELLPMARRMARQAVVASSAKVMRIRSAL